MREMRDFPRWTITVNILKKGYVQTKIMHKGVKIGAGRLSRELAWQVVVDISSGRIPNLVNVLCGHLT